MAYSETYTADDTAKITIDLVASVIAAFVSFATLVALVMLFGWFRKRAGKLKM